jgi:hypothetical protein
MGLRYLQTMSAGRGGIVPVLFQQGAEHIFPHLCPLFRACMTYGFIPTAWRQVKENEAKAYRPIVFSFENDGETSG